MKRYKTLARTAWNTAIQAERLDEKDPYLYALILNIAFSLNERGPGILSAITQQLVPKPIVPVSPVSLTILKSVLEPEVFVGVALLAVAALLLLVFVISLALRAKWAIWVGLATAVAAVAFCVVWREVRRVEAPLSQGELKFATQMYERGVALEPGYGLLYANRLLLMLPSLPPEPTGARIIGAPMPNFTKKEVADVKGLIERAADLTKQDMADAMYAGPASFLLNTVESRAFIGQFRLDGERICRGFQKLLEMRPRSGAILDQFCYLACIYKDRTIAKDLFQRLEADQEQTWWLDDNPYENPSYYWMSKNINSSYKSWALYDTEYPRGTLLQYAVYKPDLMMLDQLFKAPLEEVNVPDERGRTPLSMAINKKNMQAAVRLLELGADPNIPLGYWGTPLCAAVDDDDPELAEALFNHGAKPDVCDLTASSKPPLWVAVDAGNLRMVELLLKHGADPNLALKDSSTPLRLAVTKRNLDVLESLLEHGANPDVPDQRGWAALRLVVENGDREMLRFLLDHGANPNVTAPNGSTPLHAAAQKGDVEGLKILCDREATDINSLTIQERTSLHLAACEGHDEVVELLLAKGAQMNLRDWNGQTALGGAKQKGHSSTVELLLRHGAVE